jgi:hypothetical protein
VVVIALLGLLAFGLLRLRARGFFAERRRLREERKIEEQPTQRRRIPRRAKAPPETLEPDAEAAQAEEAALYARSYIEWLDKQ